LAATVLWHHGQALSFGHGAGFASLAAMVRARADISPDDPTSSHHLKLQALVDDLLSAADPDVRQRVLRALGRLLGMDDGRELIDLGELFSSWRLLFERLAARGPVVMLFEDLQWADQGLFDFIAHMSEWAARSQILVLVFSRPDERLDAVSLLGQRLDLSPLSEHDIESLVAAAVEDAPEGLLNNVRENAAGVPLFAVESLRMLAARGAMTPAGDANRYRLVSQVHDLDVPPSIHALVAARLDRLGDLERSVLRGGAVLGQRFTAAAAAAVAGVGAADGRSLLDGLVSKQFLSVDTDPRSQSRGTYAFVHRQVERVVLETLSKRARKARHLAAVDYLSELADDPDLPAILAGHLVSAYEAHPTAPDATDIRRRALRLTLDAAQRAEGVGALNEAVDLFAQAAHIETDESRRAEHLVRAARCAERYGNAEIAAGHYAAARELLQEAGLERAALRVRARELSVYQWSRSPSDLIGPLRNVYERLRDQEDAAFADAAVSLAVVLYSDGAAELAESMSAQAARAAERAEAYEELGLALNCRASALIELARPVEALPVFQAALEIRKRYAPSDVPASLGNVAITFTALGRFDEAVTAGREAMAAGERVASRVHRNLAALQLARALFSLGRWDEAASTVEEAAPETAPANRGMLIGPPLLMAIHRGDLDTARAILDEFDRARGDSAVAFESDYRSLRDVALAHLDGAHAEALAIIARAQSGDYAEWPSWLPLAVDLVSQLPGEAPLRETAQALAADVVPKTSPYVKAQSARVDALLASRCGDTARAAEQWSEAIGVVGQAGMAFHGAALRLELSEHVPERAGTAEDLRAAVDTFTGLRATPWLERARRALRAAEVATLG
jgi:tetratricopeptide (TPR) repeat protein